MVILTTETFNSIGDYLHPNLNRIVKQDKLKDDKLVVLPPYHGCGYKNKNGTRKSIDYGRGYRCITPSWRRSWKKHVKKKYLNTKYPKTRYRLNSEYRNLFKNKGNYVYNYKLQKYKSIEKEGTIKKLLNSCWSKLP